MPLESKHFKDDSALEACLIHDSAHVTRGAAGNHVRKIQSALQQVNHATISPAELSAGEYGQTTADAVRAYKQDRDIVNTSYQTKADDIVGKMTIAELDKEMLGIESGAVAKAFATIPDAVAKIRLAITRLTAVRSSYSVPNPLFTGKERKVVEWNFKVDRTADPAAQIDKIRAIYELMNETLFRASHFAGQWNLFRFSKRHPTSPGAPAYTTLGGNDFPINQRDRSREFKNAIYVTPEFSNKVFAASILIHELSHYCGGKDGSATSIEHRASPLPPPHGKRLEDGTTNYADMTADLAYRNAQSYQLYCDPDGLGKPPQ
jgi:peptidoglycan hydrolase-like protein with peptidoglycan-binding domain